MSFDADPDMLEPGNPLTEQGLEEEAEAVLSYLDGLGPHPTLAHRVHDEDCTAPSAAYEEIVANVDVDEDVLPTVLDTLEQVGEVYEHEGEYAVTSPSEYREAPDGRIDSDFVTPGP